MAQQSASLWMGDLEPHMDEGYLTRLFDGMGYKVVSVRLIKDKVTGRPAGYCFLEFQDNRTAHSVLMNLNLKPWPNSKKLLKLNWASSNTGNKQEHSVYVGELDHNVNDHKLFKYFAGYFPSCKSAKIVVDEKGNSKGFGFVRFANEEDAKNAICKFNLSSDLCTKRIRVCKAFPKQVEKANYSTPSNANSNYGYGGGVQEQWLVPQPPQIPMQQFAQPHNLIAPDNPYIEDLDLIPYDTEQTVDEMNMEFIALEDEFESIVENTKWPVMESVTSNKPIAFGLSSSKFTAF